MLLQFVRQRSKLPGTVADAWKASYWSDFFLPPLPSTYLVAVRLLTLLPSTKICGAELPAGVQNIW